MTTATTEEKTELVLRTLLDAGLHFGHQTKRWNPKMKKYIFDKRGGIHIIDLTKTLALLQAARKVAYDIVASGKKVLFVGTKKQAQKAVEEASKRCNQPFVVTRWLGGTLTNNVTIRNSIRRFHELEKMFKEGTFAKMSQKEVSRLRHEMTKLSRNLLGISNMTDLPGAIMVIDTNREKIAVTEANKLNIPVIAVVDTCSDPDPVDYPIPGNDDAIRAIRVIVDAMAEAIQKADGEYAVKAAERAKNAAASGAETPAASTSPRSPRPRRRDGPGKDRAPRPRRPGAPGGARRGAPRAPRAAPAAAPVKADGDAAKTAAKADKPAAPAEQG